MCRHLAYIGPPVTLEHLLLQPPHSLLDQARAPRHQTYGNDNPDGFGVGWYDRALRSEPAQYRTERPIWTDASFGSLAGVVTSNAVLAAVRKASPGMPLDEKANAPFTDGPWLFSHNGVVPQFDGDAGRALRADVTDQRASLITAATDSALLFALVLDRLDAGESPADALVSVVQAVDALTADARLNFLLTDGERIAATAFGNSLFVLDQRHGSGAVAFASEPYDDARWDAVPDGSVVELADDKLETRPI